MPQFLNDLAMRMSRWTTRHPKAALMLVLFSLFLLVCLAWVASQP